VFDQGRPFAHRQGSQAKAPAILDWLVLAACIALLALGVAMYLAPSQTANDLKAILERSPSAP